MGKSNNNKSSSGRKVSFRILFYVFLALFIAFVISNVITLLGYLDVIAFKIEQRIMNNIRSNIKKHFKKIKDQCQLRGEEFDNKYKSEHITTTSTRLAHLIMEHAIGDDKTKRNAAVSVIAAGRAYKLLSILTAAGASFKDKSASSSKKMLLKTLKSNRYIKHDDPNGHKFEEGEKITKDVSAPGEMGDGAGLRRLRTDYPGIGGEEGIAEDARLAALFIVGLKLISTTKGT